MKNEHTNFTLEELREKQEKLKKVRSAVDGSGDAKAISEYAKKVFSDKKASNTDKVFSDLVSRFGLEEEKGSALTYEEGRSLLWKLMKAYALAYPAKFPSGAFEVDQRNKGLIQSLLKYYLGMPGDLDTHKGLFITGPTGVGKTVLLEVFQRFAKCDGTKFRFKVYQANGIYNDYKETGHALIEFLSRENICIDDLGAEPPIYKEYGNDVKPLLDLLEKRHQRSLIDPFLRTFVTTNLSTDEIGERYGHRIHDRLKAFNIIRLTGDSRR